MIINSNTNQNQNHCYEFINMAKKFGFETEVYRCMDFYPNLHGVSDKEVAAAFIRLNQRPVHQEIILPTTQEPSETLQRYIDLYGDIAVGKVPFDENTNSYITKDFLRFGDSFIAKNSSQYPELRVLKYKNEVFWNNGFNDALLEMRGTVINENDDIVIRPFKKVFNYSERIADDARYPIEMDDNAMVYGVVKVNGFMGACTYIDVPDDANASYNKKVLYSTTGSLNSDFAKMTQEHCHQFETMYQDYPNHTFLFEVNDERDPHVIKEEMGATLIGCVEVKTGRQWTEKELDAIAQQYGVRRPATTPLMPFHEMKALLNTVEHEGFMVFDENDNMLFKMKSPYYLMSKMFGRGAEQTLLNRLDKRNVAEEFYPLIDHINDNRDSFFNLTEHEKFAFVQDFIVNQFNANNEPKQTVNVELKTSQSHSNSIRNTVK